MCSWGGGGGGGGVPGSVLGGCARQCFEGVMSYDVIGCLLRGFEVEGAYLPASHSINTTPIVRKLDLGWLPDWLQFAAF